MSERIRQRSVMPRRKAEAFKRLASDPDLGIQVKIFGDARNNVNFKSNNIDSATGEREEHKFRVPKGAVIVQLTGTLEDVEVAREIAYFEMQLDALDN